MDLSQLPERDRNKVSRLLEAKQAQQFLSLYGYIVDQCFKDCINDFTSEAVSGGEKDCVKKCTLKHMKLTNRAGIFMAEKQNLMAPPTSTNNTTTK